MLSDKTQISQKSMARTLNLRYSGRLRGCRPESRRRSSAARLDFLRGILSHRFAVGSRDLAPRGAFSREILAEDFLIRNSVHHNNENVQKISVKAPRGAMSLKPIAERSGAVGQATPKENRGEPRSRDASTRATATALRETWLLPRSQLRRLRTCCGFGMV